MSVERERERETERERSAVLESAVLESCRVKGAL
jgi:hypothetical protein